MMSHTTRMNFEFLVEPTISLMQDENNTNYRFNRHRNRK